MSDILTGEICLNCRHWRGDRERQLAELKDRGEVCMDRERGWPKQGQCLRMVDYCEQESPYGQFEVILDPARVQTPSWFGCILFEPWVETMFEPEAYESSIGEAP